MNKRGLSHVDWVISFGVFVIFLLLLFIWFGPSLSSEYSEEYLGEIASKGFKEASYHEVFRYPIFVEIFGPNFPERRIDVYGMDKAGATSDVNLAMYDFDGSLINDLELNGDQLRFTTHPPSSGVYSYLLYYSNYSNNVHVPAGGNPTTVYNATLGIGERLYGFSEVRFNDLSALGYEEFKEALKYPLTKNVNVYVYDSVTFTNLLYNYNVSEPTENDNVYVVSWSDVMINEDGSVTPISVLVKTW